jgi:hypothetical protein
LSVPPIRGGSSVDALGEVVGASIVMAYPRRVDDVHVVFAIVIATILATPVGVAVYSSQTVALMAGSGVRDMFSFVSVSLRVLDADGNPINRAQVKPVDGFFRNKISYWKPRLTCICLRPPLVTPDLGTSIVGV